MTAALAHVAGLLPRVLCAAMAAPAALATGLAASTALDWSPGADGWVRAAFWVLAGSVAVAVLLLLAMS